MLRFKILILTFVEPKIGEKSIPLRLNYVKVASLPIDKELHGCQLSAHHLHFLGVTARTDQKLCHSVIKVDLESLGSLPVSLIDGHLGLLFH